MHKRYLTLVLCCGAIAAAGCGSSSGGSGSTGAATGPVNLSTFKTDVSTLCTGAHNAVKGARGNTAAEIKALSSYLPKFKSITPPPSVAAAYTAFINALQGEVSAFQAGNNQQAVKEALAARAAVKKLNIPACSNSSA